VDKRKLLARIINNPRSVRFSDAVVLVEAFGFHLSRVRGSHHLFVHPGIAELVNFQEVHGQAKPYQVRQFLKIVERHNLRLGGEQ
jgi:predicted RNA binding protein YcfA (HicA-like mRNA interferase family)